MGQSTRISGAQQVKPNLDANNGKKKGRKLRTTAHKKQQEAKQSQDTQAAKPSFVSKAKSTGDVDPVMFIAKDAQQIVDNLDSYSSCHEYGGYVNFSLDKDNNVIGKIKALWCTSTLTFTVEDAGDHRHLMTMTSKNISTAHRPKIDDAISVVRDFLANAPGSMPPDFT